MGKFCKMRLSNVMLYYIRRRPIPGKMDIGKKRIYPNMYPEKKLKHMKEAVQELENLDTISRPYLTEEEEFNHMEDMGYTEQYYKNLEIAASIEKSWIPHRLMSDRLKHLEVNKAWE